MITCSKCSKENQDHYKFCLGCGAELPRDAAPKPFAPRTPAQGIKAIDASASQQSAVAPAKPAEVKVARPAAAPRPVPSSRAAVAPVSKPVSARQPTQDAVAEPADAEGIVECPQCGHKNSVAFKFCASCGFNLSKLSQRAPAPAIGADVTWTLTQLRADGSDAGTFEVPQNDSFVGRDKGGIFEGDSYLSPQHAKLSCRNGKLFVQDADSVNGTYVKLRREVSEPLEDGQVFRIGQEIIRFEKLHPEEAQDGVLKMGSPSEGYVGRIVLITGRDTTGNAFPVPESGIHIGRERGHILFPEDGYVSGLHCALTSENGELYLTDMGSSNGTFIRLINEREMADGDILLMGQQLFRANY